MKIIFTFLFCLAFIAHAKDSIRLNINRNAQNFTISLPANPTTGYQWALKKYDASFLKLSKAQFQKPQTQFIGAGGKMVFTFNKINIYPKCTAILFKYARPWEPQAGSYQKVIVNFQ